MKTRVQAKSNAKFPLPLAPPTHAIEFLADGATKLHVLDEVCPLTFVRCDDAYLVRLHPSLDQLCHQLLHISHLCPV